jgi:hypothetical protein
MSSMPPLETDTAMVLGMASTAMPFARDSEAEAERWLRILRLHGDAGVALQALGVSEARLEEPAGRVEPARADPAARSAGDVVATVSEGASRLAARRGAARVCTSDVLGAVIDVYAADFDRVLRVHGTDREEVLARLELERPERREPSGP